MCEPEFIAPQIVDAIREGALAGTFWRAARLNPDSAAVWDRVGLAHHRRASAFLEAALADLNAPGGGGPCYYGDGG